jgi:hypothetical protein
MIDKNEFNLILSPSNGGRTMSMIISLLHKLKQNKKCLIIGYENEILDKIKFLAHPEKISTEIKNNLFIIDINSIYINKINIYELERFINDEKIDFLFIDNFNELYDYNIFVEKKSIKKEVIIEKKQIFINPTIINKFNRLNLIGKLSNLCYRKNIGILVNLPRSNNQHINPNINFSLYLPFLNIFQITSKENNIIGLRSFVSFRFKTIKDRESKYPKQFNINNNML